MKKFATIISVLIILFSVGTPAFSQQSIPPLGENKVYMTVTAGNCGPGGMIEIGTYKPGIDKVWTRSPRKFVEPCE